MSNEENAQRQDAAHPSVIERITHPLSKRHQRGEIRPEDLPGDIAPEDLPGLPGAEGGSHSDSANALPGMPTKDGTPWGSTDQHSDA